MAVSLTSGGTQGEHGLDDSPHRNACPTALHVNLLPYYRRNYRLWNHVRFYGLAMR